jgi:putative DNA primase/helicase
MAAVERLAMAGDAMGVTSSIWDADPFLLGTPGGTIDLKTGERYDAKPEDYITKLAAVAPTNEADCPLWLKFLTETTGGDAELIRFLQQWSGYTLTGDTREHQLLFIYGAGGNGKTVFINVLSGILHEYAKSAAMDTFTASRYAKHPTELAWLRGARLVTASETEDGHAWAEAKINLFTGGDLITARFMNKDFFEFWPVFKLTIVGNHKPELRNANDAAKRRHNIVPFNHKPISPDRQLEHKLHAEWPAILRWMIDGCLDWQRNGLVRPAIVTDATDEYFSVQDSFGSWMADCCVRDPKAKERPHVLLLNLNHWAEKNAEKQVTRKRFRNWVEQQEWLTYKTVRGADFVAGIRLLTDSELNQKNHEW